MCSPKDKAGKKYWSKLWEESTIPSPIDPSERGRNTYRHRRRHELFCEFFADMETQERDLLEIGGARSRWLPYFAQEFGFQVTAMDYSEPGCELAQGILTNAGIEGTVVCADAFSPPSEMAEAFDVVASFGVVEHFQDTASCIKAFSFFLRPGGLLITFVPHLKGLPGLITRIVNREAYERHVPLGVADLKNAYAQAGLHVVRCEYFLFFNRGTSLLRGMDMHLLSSKAKALLVGALDATSKLVAMLDDYLGVRLPSNRLTSPRVLCIGRKHS
ncbi:MAG TPA: class I SAM-dependent methyltransferase [Thermoguttaceae bacterium]|nr:class I SAM-dependent methyltransferase [Thermoguttaceae bacterium]